MSAAVGLEPPRTIPWDRPEQDLIFQQVAVVSSWIVVLAVQPIKKYILSLESSLHNAWKTFMSFEQRAVLELLLEGWLKLLAGPLQADEWKELYFLALARRAGRIQEIKDQSRHVGGQRYVELQDAVRETARSCFPTDRAAGDRWEDAFFAEERVTTAKLRRLSDEEFEHVVAELEAAPKQLASRRATLTAADLPTSWALPTADALFLHAHDAYSSSSSRFKRFQSFVHDLVVVYRASKLHDPHDTGAVARLEGVHGPLARTQQADAFAALPLELQVSAVDHARLLVFDACRRTQTGYMLLNSERVVGLLEEAFVHHGRAGAAPTGFVSTHAYPIADEAYRNELARLTGGEHVGPSRSQAPRSLGKETSSRFFPAARTASW
ncbi:hypothetical protein JCM9279_004011 [Rhodotorula babjevae]